MKVGHVKREEFERLERSLREMTAQLVALTAVVGRIATGGTVDYERLEECVNFAVNMLSLGTHPVLLTKPSAILSDFERMQRALQVESRKNRGLKHEPMPNAKAR